MISSPSQIKNTLQHSLSHNWNNEQSISDLIEHFTFPDNSETTVSHALHVNGILKHESHRHSRLTVAPFDSYCFIYTANENCELIYDGLNYLLIPESFVFLDCRKGFTLLREEIISWSSYIILFDGSNSSYYYDQFYTDQIAAFPLPAGSSIPEKVSALFSTCVSLWNDRMTEFMNSKLIMDLLILTMIEKSDSPARNNNLPNHVINAVNYINQHYNLPLSLDRIADELNISKYTLSHDFTKYIGISVMENILQLRIKEAKLLLSTSERNVNEIAHAIGFSSDVHFIQTFKKREGITPLQYRKQHNLLSYSHLLN